MKQPLLISVILLCVAIVVVLGAYTRLVHAGLGCPDWPTCYGHLWVPNTVTEIETANLNFTLHPVETDKTWPEQIHRIFASSLGLLILILTVFISRDYTKKYRKSSLNSITFLLSLLVLSTGLRVALGSIVEFGIILLALLYFANLYRVNRSIEHVTALSERYILSFLLCGLVVVQGLFGMWTVTLKLWPQVVSAHLLGGFASLLFISILWRKLCLPNLDFTLPEGCIRVVAKIAFTILLIQIFLGGWTSSNYAALACPDIPKCQNQWLPKADFASGFNLMQAVGPNYLGGQLDNYSRIAIHYTHRVFAGLATVSISLLIAFLWRKGGRIHRRLAVFISIALAAQLSLGITNVVLSLPIAIAVLHNAMAATLLVLTSLVVLYPTKH